MRLQTSNKEDAQRTEIDAGVVSPSAEISRTEIDDRTLITSIDDSVPGPGIPQDRPTNPDRFGRYEIEAWIGAGAMGDVYRARDPQLDRMVAVKVPKVDRRGANYKEFSGRFLREARTAAAVRHTHICPIYDTGEADGTPFVVMAFVDGESLAQRLKRQGRYEDPREAVALVLNIAEALHEVHQHGIVHRDLKPGNILVDQSGTALLTDFGLARSFVIDERLTIDGGLVGTPAYMSPEQALGEKSIGPASDLYGLGMVLYELLTGKLPFSGGAMAIIVNKSTQSAPVSPVKFRPDLDLKLVEIVLKAIAQDPNNRFESARRFANSLQNWLDSTTDESEREPDNRSKESTSAVVEGRLARSMWSWPLQISGMLAVFALSAAGFGYFNRIDIRPETREKDPNVSQHLVDTKISTGAALPGLKGNVEVFVWSDPAKASIARGTAKNGASVSHPGSGALPLHHGELVHLHVTLNRPAFVYLIWIDSDGRPSPLYPWDASNSDALWDAPFVKEFGMPTETIDCPQISNRGFVVSGTPGIQHVVLLARTTALESPGKTLQVALNHLPSSPLANKSEIAYLEWSPIDGSRSVQLRGVTTGKTKVFDEPVFDVLKERLQQEFELIKVWRFPQVED